MLEEKTNILSDKILIKADAICFTSNGIVKKSGELVMGAGVAKAFKNKFVGIDKRAGNIVNKNGNVCQIVSYEIDKSDSLPIISFPTKYHWRNPSSLSLIKKSAEELMRLIEMHGWKKVYLPRPGCANGGLQWASVKSAIENILDDRVVICYL